MSNIIGVDDRVEDADIALIRPVQDFVLLKEIPREKTGGGIWLPKGKGTEVVICEVVRVGNGIWNDATMGFLSMDLAPSDLVLTIDYFADMRGGARIATCGGDHYRFVRSNGIWAKVRVKNRATYELAEVEPRFTAVIVRPYDETMMDKEIMRDDGSTVRLFRVNEQDHGSQLRRATVLEIGPGPWNHKTGKRQPMPYARGQMVLMGRYAGSEIIVKGETLRLLHDDDIKCEYSGD